MDENGLLRSIKVNGGVAELATVRLASGNERLAFLECPSENLPPVLPYPVLTNKNMCDVLKVRLGRGGCHSSTRKLFLSS